MVLLERTPLLQEAWRNLDKLDKRDQNVKHYFATALLESTPWAVEATGP